MKNKKNLIILSSIVLFLILLYMVVGLNAMNFNFVFSFRLKKIVSVLVVSVLIAYASISFQTITHNRLLTPSVMGLDSLYILIQTLMVFLFKFSESNRILNFVLSIGLMVLMSIILFRIFFKDNQRNVYFLILSGMVLGTLFSSLSNFISLLMDPHEFDLVTSRSMASFASVDQQLLFVSIGLGLILFFFILKDIEHLDVLSLGRDKAINLGVDYSKTVKKHLVLISIAIGMVSSLVGPLSFLSILVASLARQLTKGFSHKVMIGYGSLISAGFLILSLWMIEQVLNHQTTISVLINFVGGIYFIGLMLKERQV